VAKQICLYAMMRYNRLVWEFMITVIGSKYSAGDRNFSKMDLSVFFMQLQEQNDVVATWLAVYEPTPTGVDNIDVEKKTVKVIRDGQMFIIRDNVVYSVLGQVVK
jgi:hypothetical protein